MRLISLCLALITALVLTLSGSAQVVDAVADHSHEHVLLDVDGGHHHHGQAPAHSHVLAEVLGGLAFSPMLPQEAYARSAQLGINSGPGDWADCCYQLKRPPRV